MATAGILALGLSAPPALAQSQEEIPLLPPNAKPGECYARVLVPEQYQTTTQRVLKREGGEQVEVVPAKFETVEQEILVKEASSILEVVPARFETREEQVVVKPAETRLEAVPAQYETVTEEVLIKPGYTTWKLGRGPIETIDAATGEIMCLVEVPPEYATVEKTVLRSPATVRAVEIPAEVITVTKEVMVEPPTTRTVESRPSTRRSTFSAWSSRRARCATRSSLSSWRSRRPRRSPTATSSGARSCVRPTRRRTWSNASRSR